MHLSKPPWDRLWTGVNLATMTDPALGTIEDGAIAVAGGRIAWLGKAADLPTIASAYGPGEAADGSGEPADGSGEAVAGSAGAAASSAVAAAQPLARKIVHCDGAWMTPGLIDCHTHIVFGGDRVDEFRRRLHGESYEEIALSGGGIWSTVRATRRASVEELAAGAVARARELMAWGVATVEVKSGYGLDVETELKMLDAAAQVGVRLPLDVRPTLLAAHALPPEFAGRRDEYVRLVVERVVPAALEQGIACAVDAFCEEIAFSPGETRAVLRAGLAGGLHARLHADQLSDGGGGALAASVGARTADHLEYLSAAGVASMSAAGVTAVLLPGAAYTLQSTRKPPVSAMRQAGVAMAVATDANPGSSPITNVGAVLNMACVLFGLTPEEALRGFTAVAARALELECDRGTLAPGMRADMALWNVGDPAELCYWVGRSPLAALIKDGEPVPVGVP